jgi:hypothetical protein
MTNRDESDENDELSEEQRISLLEKSVTTNKVVLLILALILIVAISVTLTVMIITGMSDEEPPLAGQEAFVQVQNEIIEINQQITDQKNIISKLEKDNTELKGLLENSSAPTFQKVLLQQEKSYQSFIKSMKTGMYDLAHMVPGSRTWLELYNEQMNKALQLSQQRERELKRLQTGEMLIEPDF